jgi:hypothetical protein
VGPSCQRLREIPVQDSCPVGRGLDRRLGQIGPLRPFPISFIHFPFSFLFSDLVQIPFVNFNQTNSNKFLNCSNLLSNVLNP